MRVGGPESIGPRASDEFCPLASCGRLVARGVPADMRAVSEWTRLNEAALVDYWDFTIDTDEFLPRLQPLSPPIPP